MFEKIAENLAKINGMIFMAAALGIVVLVFIIGLVCALGGELSQFKKVAKKVAGNPTLSVCNATAKQLPTRVRKQYKTVKQTGAKPDDVITPDACVYAPFRESAAARFPGAVMAAGILSIFLSFFAALHLKDAAKAGYVPCLIVTAGVMVLRLAAGLISTAIMKSGVKAYSKYTETLNKVLAGGGSQAAEQAESQPEPQPAAQAAYANTFDAPTHITVELADDEPQAAAQTVYAQAEPIEAQPEPQPVVAEQSAENEAEARAKARAEAMARMRAEQAAAQAAAAQRAQQAQPAQPQAAAQPQAEPQPATQSGSSADEVIARIEKIKQEGGSIAQMKEVALLLQKERAKPENKTPEQQRKLNEALASLLKAMSSATKK